MVDAIHFLLLTSKSDVAPRACGRKEGKKRGEGGNEQDSSCEK